MQNAGMQQSPDGLSLDPSGYQQPMQYMKQEQPFYVKQEHTQEMQPINVRCDLLKSVKNWADGCHKSTCARKRWKALFRRVTLQQKSKLD